MQRTDLLRSDRTPRERLRLRARREVTHLVRTKHPEATRDRVADDLDAPARRRWRRHDRADEGEELRDPGDRLRPLREDHVVLAGREPRRDLVWLRVAGHDEQRRRAAVDRHVVVTRPGVLEHERETRAREARSDLGAGPSKPRPRAVARVAAADDVERSAPICTPASPRVNGSGIAPASLFAAVSGGGAASLASTAPVLAPVSEELALEHPDALTSAMTDAIAAKGRNERATHEIHGRRGATLPCLDHHWPVPWCATHEPMDRHRTRAAGILRSSGPTCRGGSARDPWLVQPSPYRREKATLAADFSLRRARAFRGTSRAGSRV